MSKPDVLVLKANRPKQMAMLAEAYRLHRYDEAADPAALLAEVGPSIRAAIGLGESKVDQALLEKLPKLEIVSLASVGYDSVDIEACRARGIKLTNTPDVLTNDVADLALVLLLSILRRVPQGDRYIREGRWAKEGSMPLAKSATGLTVGILGLGRIGKAIAKRLEAVGMKIGYHGRHQQKDVTYGYYKNLKDMAADRDVLIIASPGGPATRGIVSAEVIEALGPEGYIVNIGRGSVIDEAALLAALKEGKIAGAALDVFLNEPEIDEGFFALDNVVLQPHVGSATSETRDAMAQLVVDNLAAHFAGKPLLTPVE
ncbi:Lactate dehydrogenase [Arboricoccus pini]|uniref:Lactate dehydrogenase n=1 Tax=Arboricoccus pini TaxID=1963835 RepID=A0A212RDK4_9PROT|nr:2-hydroxyacid dehydrogenase [Arboricoccus pini]SNB70383.1 Lactate dehydrogenase [Arboricoccus pini]